MYFIVLWIDHYLLVLESGDKFTSLAWIIPAVVLALIVIAFAAYLYSLATRNSHHASSKFTFTNFIMACLSAIGLGTRSSSNNRRNLTKISRINGCTSTSSGADSLKNIDMEAATSIMSSVEMPLLARGSTINQEDLNKLPHVNDGHSVDMIAPPVLSNCGPVEFITNTTRTSQVPSICGAGVGGGGGSIGVCTGGVGVTAGAGVGVSGGNNSSIGGTSNFVGGRTSTSSVTTNTAARTDQTTLLSTIVSDGNFSSSGSGPPLLIQRSIARQIDLKGVIGKGRFGEVFKGDWRGETVAVKIFSSLDEASWQREVEIYQTSMLRHENILGYISADNKDNGTWIQLWLITDYHEHGSLHDYLTTHTLTVGEMTSMALSIAAGLSHLHHEIDGFQGKPAIAHRDLKSKNILVKSNKTCAIADLGLAVRQLSDSSGVDLPSAKKVGTRRYLPPEVLVITDDNLKISEFDFDAFIRGDIYSFGLVLWELANRTTFHIDNSSSTTTTTVDGRISMGDTSTTNTTQVPANDYQLPYHNMVSFDPTIEEMKYVVVDKNLRPPLTCQWNNNCTMKRLSQIMTECWAREPKARITTLRAKKNLSTLNKSLNESCTVNSSITINTINSSKCNTNVDTLNAVNTSMSSNIISSANIDDKSSKNSLNSSLSSSNNIAANDNVNICEDILISRDNKLIINQMSSFKLHETTETQLNAINDCEFADSTIVSSSTPSSTSSSSSSSSASSSSSLTNVPPSADDSCLLSSDSSQSTVPVKINGSLNTVDESLDNDLIASNLLQNDQCSSTMSKKIIDINTSNDCNVINPLTSSKNTINNSASIINTVDCNNCTSNDIIT